MANKKNVSLRDIFLKFYLDDTNRTTFLNGTESAIAAGYKCKNRVNYRNTGAQTVMALKPRINAWIDEHGLSEEQLKLKLFSLLEAQKTEFIKIKGAVNADDLPEGFGVVAITGVIEEDKDGNQLYGTGETVIMANMAALETQRRTLDMALKIKRMYPATQHQVGGPDGGPIPIAATVADVMDIKALTDAIGLLTQIDEETIETKKPPALQAPKD